MTKHPRKRRNVPALLFPSLIFARDARIGKRRTRVKIYTLLWKEIDKPINRMTGKKLWRKLNSSFELSKNLRATMNTLVFAIPGNYLKEIEHYRKLAIEEWGRRRGLDTVVNDECLIVGKECVDKFFFLLSDCIYDGEKEYYCAEYGIAAAWKCAMLFRFWLHQTGGAWVSENSDIKEVLRLKKSSGRLKLSTKEKETIKFVLDELNKHPLSNQGEK